jgi:hypothetical protein
MVSLSSAILRADFRDDLNGTSPSQVSQVNKDFDSAARAVMVFCALRTPNDYARGAMKDDTCPASDAPPNGKDLQGSVEECCDSRAEQGRRAVAR